MPSQSHETLLLFRNRPDAADPTQVQPLPYLADLVVLLLHGEPVLGIVVELQLSPDERKRYVWPVYVAGLRARFECPVCLLVVAADESTARWAGKVLDLGGGNRFPPLVLSPSGVPVVADGRGADVERAVRIALAAQAASEALDAERSGLYFHRRTRHHRRAPADGQYAAGCHERFGIMFPDRILLLETVFSPRLQAWFQ